MAFGRDLYYFDGGFPFGDAGLALVADNYNANAATVLGWPDSGKVTLRALAEYAGGVAGEVQGVSLLGVPGNAPFVRTTDGLEVTFPSFGVGDYAYVLKIAGLDLASTPH